MYSPPPTNEALAQAPNPTADSPAISPSPAVDEAAEEDIERQLAEDMAADGDTQSVVGGSGAESLNPEEAPARLTGAEEEGDPPIVGAPQRAGCFLSPTTTEPIGYGRATTGGGDTEPVEVRSFEEAEDALVQYRGDFRAGTRSALVLRYTGVFDYSTITDVCAQHEREEQRLQIQDMANVTFEGAQGSSANFGIHINRASNVIVRNMTLGLLPGGEEADAISIEGNGTNGSVEDIWIDHNELFSSTKDDCPEAGDAEFDGLIDIKRGARRITVSYNYLHDHQGTGLLGSDDEDDTERYVTFHHNRYENVASRTPLLRFGYAHMFNNYYGRISKSAINVRMGGSALIESNFFENVRNPVTSRYSEDPGFWELRNNHVGSGISWDEEPLTIVNAVTWMTTAIFPPEQLDYPYEVDPANCVKLMVRAAAGATL